MVEIKLLAKGTKGSRMFRGEYKDALGNTWYLINDGRKAVQQITAEEKVYTRSVAPGTPLIFNLDETKASAFDGVMKFIKNHPNVASEGHDNPNLSLELFELIIPAEKTSMSYVRTITKLAVASKIYNMEDDELAEVAFALGGDARGKDKYELFNYLVGEQLNGLATANADSFIQYQKMNSAVSIALLYANKAHRYGVITKENELYKCNERILGNSISQVADAFRSDSDLFDGYIKKEVDRFDQDAKAKIVKNTIDMSSLPQELIDEIPAVVSKNAKAVAKK